MDNEKMTKRLPVRLTAPEVELRAATLAERIDEVRTVKAEAKEVAKNFKTRADEIERDIAELAACVRSGREYREVECTLEPDFTKGVMRTVRTDTNETIETRPLTKGERQAEMFTREEIAH